MDLREEILKGYSKLITDGIVSYIGTDKKKLQDLVALFMNDGQKIAQRASWVLSTVAEKHPQLVVPHLAAMIKRMNDPDVHLAVKRNVVRALVYVTIPGPLHGLVMDNCFNLLANPKETVAVRCHAMSVLSSLSKIYPGIRQELVAIIEDALQHEPTAGFRARARMVLKEK